MVASVLDSDEGMPFKREPPDKDPSRRILGPDGMQRTTPAQAGTTAEAPEFSPALARRSSVRASTSILRFSGFVLAAAAIAGVAGFLAGGARLSTEPSAASRDTVIAPPASLTVQHVQASNRSSENPAERTPAIDVANVSADRAIEYAAAAPRSAPPAPPSAVPALPPDQQASDIAAKMKLGADLIAAGDIVAARTVFERVAEAGEAAGAFALAETYDPAVLGTMPLRGGIVPDSGLARRWYEQARDLGSKAASERLTKLAGQ